MMDNPLLLRNLHTFTIAANSLSFTQAGHQLHITQGAVSHRIKVLEKELGFSLFVRGTRKLELTPEGERFNKTLIKSLNAIYSDINDINSTEMTGELSIAVSPNFANGWLFPRLSDFKQRYPGFNLCLQIHDQQRDLVANNTDVAFYYGTGHLNDVYCQPLLEESYVPVCTPEYAKNMRMYEDGNEALRKVNFLRVNGSRAWENWLNHMGIDINSHQQTYTVSSPGMEITAARYSSGIAMGRYLAVKPMIESGELVTPYAGMKTNQKYCVLCSLGSESRPKIKTFLSWVNSQLS
ncbi:LysR substrate-binding domain-containing protein [Vibrio hannami]|uniref:LysR substrate-binding domain-containing protein n=1 Tax=Vibrio hannami TaxID=2717094 RepID=UPI003EBD0C5B